jgi:hypothetical protein
MMTERDELPIPDFDHLPEGALASRIRSLTEPELNRLLDYEAAHGNRLPVRRLFERRLSDLRSGASPSSGDPGGRQPEHAPPPSADSPAQADHTPVNNQPLRHGVAGQTPHRPIRGR